MTERFDSAYYADLERRVVALVHAFDDGFPTEQIDLLLELAEHNEPGVAVEMLSSMLVEVAFPVAQPLRQEFQSLADTMQLDTGVWRDLTPVAPE